MRGWCYVITNPHINGLVKIGWTARQPEIRALELYTTGVPSEYQIEYAAEVAAADAAEKHAHLILRDVRENASREYFRCSVKDAISVVREAAQRYGLISERFIGVEREEAEAVQRKLAADREQAISEEMQAIRTAANAKAAKEAFEAWRQKQIKDCDTLYSIKIKDSLTQASFGLSVAGSTAATFVLTWLFGARHPLGVAILLGFVAGTVIWFIRTGSKTPLTLQLEKDSELWSSAIGERTAYICSNCGGFNSLSESAPTAVKCARCHEWEAIPQKTN